MTRVSKYDITSDMNTAKQSLQYQCRRRLKCCCLLIDVNDNCEDVVKAQCTVVKVRADSQPNNKQES